MYGHLLVNEVGQAQELPLGADDQRKIICQTPRQTVGFCLASSSNNPLLERTNVEATQFATTQGQIVSLRWVSNEQVHRRCHEQRRAPFGAFNPRQPGTNLKEESKRNLQEIYKHIYIYIYLIAQQDTAPLTYKTQFRALYDGNQTRG